MEGRVFTVETVAWDGFCTVFPEPTPTGKAGCPALQDRDPGHRAPRSTRGGARRFMLPVLPPSWGGSTCPS